MSRLGCVDTTRMASSYRPVRKRALALLQNAAAKSALNETALSKSWIASASRAKSVRTMPRLFHASGSLGLLARAWSKLASASIRRFRRRSACSGVLRFDRQRPLVPLHRIFQPILLFQGNALIVGRFGEVRFEGKCPLEQAIARRTCLDPRARCRGYCALRLSPAGGPGHACSALPPDQACSPLPECGRGCRAPRHSWA